MKFPQNFFFGVSNAANQVEDEIFDNWIRFTQKAHAVASFHDRPFPNERLRFWTQPEIEINLAKDLGVQVFRLSLSWERLVPNCNVWDSEAASRYKHILKMIKDSGMKVMLTLFHHSIPSWMEDQQGWVNKESVEWFDFYSQKAKAEFGELVDYWITLNEPVPWSYLTYAEGLFPPGIKGNIFKHYKALKHMSVAHNKFFKFVNGDTPVGIAHHMGFHTGRGVFNKLFSMLTDYLAHWQFLNSIKHHMDFFGINYYGAEWMTLAGPAQYEDLDFSDAGRAIYPEGLYILLRKIAIKFPTLPIIISENGIGDGTDNVRPAYLTQHLLAVQKAIKEGIKVIGYVHWTLSDNFEWTDGYGPKFGLVQVKREENLKRVPRDSYYLFQEIIKENQLSQQQIEESWTKYQSIMGTPREYWRSDDGKHGLSHPKMRMTPKQDWRMLKV
jgi:beta-glucosidase/6-phospho-beta-glucosidase/beta-galactosidase